MAGHVHLVVVVPTGEGFREDMDAAVLAVEDDVDGDLGVGLGRDLVTEGAGVVAVVLHQVLVEIGVDDGQVYAPRHPVEGSRNGPARVISCAGPFRTRKRYRYSFSIT